MNWKFWKKHPGEGGGGVPAIKLGKPKELPDPVGRKMVVGMKLDPDLVWSLRYVSRPMEGSQKISQFRIFNPVTVNQAGVVVKNWSSLDEHTELVMYTGSYDKSTDRVEIDES